MSPQGWSIRTKLIASFGALFLLVVALGAFGLSQLRTVNAAAAEMRETWMPSVQLLGDIKYGVTRYRLFGARQAMTADPTQNAELARSTETLVAQTLALRQAYERLIASPEERRLYEGFARAWEAYDQIHKPMLEQARRGDLPGAASVFNTTSLQSFNTTLAALDQLIKLSREGGERSGVAAQGAYGHAVLVLALGIGLGALVAALAALWINRSVSVPVVRMTDAMRALAAGRLDVAIPGAGRGDEIGGMADAVEVFRQNALSVKQMAAEAEATARRTTAEKGTAMSQLADRFETEVTGVARAVATAAEKLQASARSMNGVADGTNQQASAVAAASQQTSANVQTVAAAAEELSASVAEIGGQVTLAASAAGQASGEAQGAGERVEALASSVGRIGQVVDLINQIAAQTNLLALNATIEAARAGEAGRGFAVVASEVKTLATQTSKATEEIAGQIAAVQGATNEVVQAIEAVRGRIGQVNDISTAIAAAVQEQGAAVSEIARNVAQAAQGTEEVTRSITGVSRAAEETGQVAGQMVDASGDLARQSEGLTAQIDAFLRRVRAA